MGHNKSNHDKLCDPEFHRIDSVRLGLNHPHLGLQASHPRDLTNNICQTILKVIGNFFLLLINQIYNQIFREVGL